MVKPEEKKLLRRQISEPVNVSSTVWYSWDKANHPQTEIYQKPIKWFICTLLNIFNQSSSCLSSCCVQLRGSTESQEDLIIVIWIMNQATRLDLGSAVPWSLTLYSTISRHQRPSDQKYQTEKSCNFKDNHAVLLHVLSVTSLQETAALINTHTERSQPVRAHDRSVFAYENETSNYTLFWQMVVSISFLGCFFFFLHHLWYSCFWHSLLLNHWISSLT